MSRCERGVEIYSVSVRMCRDFNEIKHELLKEIVVDVDWHHHDLIDTDLYKDRDYEDSTEDYLYYSQY